MNLSELESLTATWSGFDFEILREFIESRNKVKKLIESGCDDPVLNKFVTYDSIGALEENDIKTLNSKRIELMKEVYYYSNLMSLETSTLSPLYCCHQDLVIFCEDYGAPTEILLSESGEEEPELIEALPIKRTRLNTT